MTKFKIGDRVKIIAKTNGANFEKYQREDGSRYRIISNVNSSDYEVNTDKNIAKGENNYWRFRFNESDLLLANNQNTMNLLQKFQNIFLKEPENSFRKAGITDSEGNLTSEGQAIFLGYLLQQHGDEFKKAIVDPILAEGKED